MTTPLHIGKPKWLKTNVPMGENYFDIKKEITNRGLHTVCQEAKCPNIGECWNQRTATFMVLGDTCTRACRFCHIKTGDPKQRLNKEEPREVAESCQYMKLKYVVLTMVNRDDLPDGGASHIKDVIDKIKELNPDILVELLSGDFNGNESSLTTVLESGLRVFAHNIETVRELSKRVRDARADYDQSLAVLKFAKTHSPSLLTKSSIMIGLGETLDQVEQAMMDLRTQNVDILTIGQYMRPTKKHLPIKEWIRPEVFQTLKEKAEQLGFRAVASGPLVRSSYKAYSLLQL